jgi:hypothetical protein
MTKLKLLKRMVARRRRSSPRISLMAILKESLVQAGVGIEIGKLLAEAALLMLLILVVVGLH